MLFVFDSLPISDNQLYSNIASQSRRFLSVKAKKYKQKIETSTLLQIASQDAAITRSCPSIPNSDAYTTQILALKDKPLIVNILLSGSWFTKTDSIRRKDAQNYCKALLDSIFNSLKTIEPALDDSQIWLLQLAKIDSDIEQTEVIITIVKDMNNLDDKDDDESMD